MADIIPAILPSSYKDLKEKLALAATTHMEHVHVDITDGSLTDKSNWPYNGSDSEWDRLRSEDAGFPYWEDLNFEAHLMVKDPEVVYEDWIRAGAERLIFQYESFADDETLTSFLLKVSEHFGGDYAHLKVEVGLAFNLETGIEKILPHVLECDFVQLMSIRQIGSQGQEFQEEIFDKIRVLRSEYPETIVSVDGGVSADNAQRLIEAGADRLCVGSAIFAAEDPLEAIDDLLDITE
jgi:ribulose-phosphate 3-epimerase